MSCITDATLQPSYNVVQHAPGHPELPEPLQVLKGDQNSG